MEPESGFKVRFEATRKNPINRFLEEDEEESESFGSRERVLSSINEDLNAATWYMLLSRGEAPLGGEEDETEEQEGMAYGAAAAETAVGGFQQNLAEFARQVAAREEAKERMVSQNPKKRFRRRMKRVCCCKRGVYMKSALLCLSLVLPLLVLAMETLSFMGNTFHSTLGSVSYFLWLLWTLVLAFFAGALTLFAFPAMTGSGIPQMRAVISGGLELSNYMQPLLLVAKFPAVCALISSGLWVGKEGPSVHMSALAATSLFEFPIFRPIKKNPQLMRSLLTAAAGAGVSCTFGSPIGGVLFTIEVTASYYRLSELWYGFLISVPGAAILRVLMATWRNTRSYGAEEITWASILGLENAQPLMFNFPDLLWLCLLAVVGSVFGVLFIELSSGTIALRRWIYGRSRFLGHPLVFLVLVVVASTLIFFPPWTGEFMSAGPLEILRDLAKPGDEHLVLRGWDNFDLRGSMMLFFVVKLFMLGISITIPGPTGLFVPLLACGAALGRFSGIVWVSIYPQHSMGPQDFAIVGAAVLCGSATQTMSVAVVVVEITGQMSLLIPVLIATLISVHVSMMLTHSVGIYERIALDLRLPFIGDLTLGLYQSTVAEIMVSDFESFLLTSETELQRVDELLEGKPRHEFPLVDDVGNMVFVGFVSRRALESYVWDIRKRMIEMPKVFMGPAVSATTLRRRKDTVAQLALARMESQAEFVAPTRRNLHEALREVKEDIKPMSIVPTIVNVTPTTPLTLLHMLFVKVESRVIAVTEKGKLVGLVYRSDFVEFLTSDRFKTSMAENMASVENEQAEEEQRESVEAEDEAREEEEHYEQALMDMAIMEQWDSKEVHL